MSFDSLVKSRIIAHIVGERRQMQRRAAFERRRARRGAGHVVEYFHDMADPYCHLTAQVLHRFQERYDIALRPHLISGPPDWAAPDRAGLDAYARADAARLAQRAGLSFPATPVPPTAERLTKARAQLAASLTKPEFAQTAVALSNAVWQGAAFPTAPETDPAEVMAQGDARLAQQGHYLGATFCYGGEWYWGLDRLHYLETRLRALGATRPGAPTDLIFPPPEPDPLPGHHRGEVIEAFISFRSPYSYLAFDRARDLARARGAEFRFRPVLPMVMRGLPVPRAKRLYIIHDAAREARRLGLPFGRICDPLGLAVERGYALIGYAREAGRLDDYASSFLRGVWAEGIDARTDRGLARIVERAGLDWDQARPRLQSDAWRAEVEDNRNALSALGLWGVPSFRVEDTAFWGQDRLWLFDTDRAKGS